MWRQLLALAAISGAAAVTGTNTCNEKICVKAVRDNGVDSYTVTPKDPTPADKFGWMAVGWGIQMPHSPLVIMWPNPDGTQTLSQRISTGHHQPSVDPNPPRVATLDQSKSFANETTVSFTFTMPANSENMTMMIWSRSRTNPRDSAVNADLIQHTWHGLEILQMEKELDLDAPPLSTPPDFYGTSKAMKKNGNASFALIAHIVCGCLVTMMVLPGGVVVPRITRGITTTRSWFYFHMVNQGIFALALICGAFGIGLSFKGELNTTHRKTGVALFCLVLLQIALGCFSHFYRPGPRAQQWTFETKRGRGPTNFMHVGMGIIVVSVGWSAAWTGLTNEWTIRGHGVPAYGWRVGWGMIVMCWIALYFLGVYFFLPRQLQIESQERAWELREQKRFFPSEFEFKERNQPVTPTPPLPSLTPQPLSPKFASPNSPQSTLSFPSSPTDGGRSSRNSRRRSFGSFNNRTSGLSGNTGTMQTHIAQPPAPPRKDSNPFEDFKSAETWRSSPPPPPRKHHYDDNRV